MKEIYVIIEDFGRYPDDYETELKQAFDSKTEADEECKRLNATAEDYHYYRVESVNFKEK